MADIALTNNDNFNLKVMIFLEGTVFYTKPFLHLLSKKGYIPIGQSVSKLNSWKEQGAQIICCTYVKKKRTDFIIDILKSNNIPADILCYREKGQSYANLVCEISPDILIEDDCKSIGGESQMCITNCPSEIKNKIYSVCVEEFKGIDNLSDDIKDFLK